MTDLEKEKLNRVLELLIDAYSECFRAIAALESSRTHGERASAPLVSRESALRQAHQELYKTLKGIP